MLKISEKNWVWEQTKGFWKQCAASATVFANKYRDELFFRTRLNIVALLVLFSLIVVATVAYSFFDVSSYIGRPSISTTTPTVVDTMFMETFNALYQKRVRNITIVLSIVVLSGVIIGTVISSVSFAPISIALNSQKQFIANIAHELRNPLATIKMNAEVSLLDTHLAKSSRETFENIVENSERISNIINDLLTLNALTTPDHIRFSPVDLTSIVRNAVQKAQPLAARKRLRIELLAEGGHPVWGNATALEQITMHLLKNAITHSHDAGRVKVTLIRTEHIVEMTVDDSGVGIPPHELHHVFEPFYRVDISRARSTGGSGLGLSIVHEIVRSHSGKIAIRSIEGKGTTVSVQIPTPHKHAPRLITYAANETARDYTQT